MITGKNLTKLIILITATVIMQIATIETEGHWIAGGNVAFPFLMAILLWYVPSRIRDFKDILKPRKDWFKMFDDYIKKQNTSLDFFKNAAKNLQELNKELKQDNDKWEEKNNEYLRKITKG